jgi:hypothetical protein
LTGPVRRDPGDARHRSRPCRPVLRDFRGRPKGPGHPQQRHSGAQPLDSAPGWIGRSWTSTDGFAASISFRTPRPPLKSLSSKRTSQYVAQSSRTSLSGLRATPLQPICQDEPRSAGRHSPGQRLSISGQDVHGPPSRLTVPWLLSWLRTWPNGPVSGRTYPGVELSQSRHTKGPHLGRLLVRSSMWRPPPPYQGGGGRRVGLYAGFCPAQGAITL